MKYFFIKEGTHDILFTQEGVKGEVPFLNAVFHVDSQMYFVLNTSIFYKNKEVFVILKPIE